MSMESEYWTGSLKYIFMEHAGSGAEMDIQTLKGLADVDIRTVAKESLVDIGNVKIDGSLSREERISDYIKQVKNPYCVQCNGIIVKMNFSQSGESLEDKLTRYFLST
nr:hypothetical protein [uncultured Acetatifactor sp.]